MKRCVALTLVLLLCPVPAFAGLIIHQGTQGLTMTGSDGVEYDSPTGLTMTGTDGLLGLMVNGIGVGSYTNGLTMTGSDGLTMTGTDGETVVAADGTSYTGSNSYTATHVDGLTMTGTDGLTMTGTDGLTMTGTDGTIYHANSVTFRQVNGLTMTGTDGVTMTGVSGLTMTGTDTVSFVRADGITATSTETASVNGAQEVVCTAPDGTIFYAPTNGLSIVGIDGLTMTGTDGVWMYGVEGLTMTGSDGVANAAATDGDETAQGLVGIDPELAILINQLTLQNLTDDSNINAVIVYHHAVTEDDLNALRAIGIQGGTRFRRLPMVIVSGTAEQIVSVSHLASVRYISGNRTLQWNADESRIQTGLTRVKSDVELAQVNNNRAPDGTGVGVAVIDTGIDSSHPDLAGCVARNVKLADLQGANPLSFSYPINVEGLANTDLVGGHGTFVSGVIAGTGARSSGKWAGYAPGAKLVGLSAGDVSLFHVLGGFDYLLANPGLGVKVVNCSFSANTLYNENDPVNVATRMLVEGGVNVVFSAGNTGPGIRTLNPYAAAPWVISVGAVDGRGRLASFSSRGDFGSRNFRPTLVAGGVEIVSLRADGVNLTGTSGLLPGGDGSQLSLSELPYYTTASGTSFSAPQVAGTIALMLQTNPQLTPSQVRDILQRTATPLPPYYSYEVGAGLLNTHAAVREAAFPDRRNGLYRSVIDRDQIEFVREPSQLFSATLMPGNYYEAEVQVPADAVLASANIAWGPITTLNDLGLQVYDPSSVKRAESNYLNLPGLTGKRESTTVSTPVAGRWRVRVYFTAGIATSPQQFMGMFQVVRVRYPKLTDVGGLDAVTLEAVRHTVRTASMWPDPAGRFRPSGVATRAQLATAMVTGARVPQYMPTSPSYLDVRDVTTMNGVESSQRRDVGGLFPDAPTGATFRPNADSTRLIAAIVLVRAAGLEAEAIATGPNALSGVTDTSSIPYSWRGHVAVARNRGLLSAGSEFKPNASITRAELARALWVISNLNTN